MPLDLSLTAARTPDGLVLRLEYSTDLYDPATITGYLDSLTGLLAAVSHDPATPLHALLGDGQTAEDGWGGSVAEEAASNGAGTSADAEYVSPATATEQRIARIWASLLSLDVAQIGASDDFFAIGGYSLLAVRLALRIGADLHIEFPIHQTFTTPTIAGQAAYADELRGRAALPSQG
jgi:acyl carrier protein